MSYNPNNPNGQASAANSAPVVLDTTDSGYLSTIVSNTSKSISDTSASGSITAVSQSVVLATTGQSTAMITTSGTFVATLQVQLLGADGATWIQQYAYALPNGGSNSSITAGGNFIVALVGAKSIRVTCTAYTSGTANVSISATVAPGVIRIDNGSGILVNGTVALGAGSTNIGYVGIQPAALSADVSLAAITTTTTSGPFTPGVGTGYQISVGLTAVSGTNPTMDVVVFESRDNGANYIPIYAFPRITATGTFLSPVFPLTGNRIQYVQTISGTSPSFTRNINRIQTSLGTARFLRQIFDRSVTLTTLSSTTAALIAEQQCTNITMTVNIGAATTAPALQIQASDDVGLTWYNIGSPLTAVASSTVSATVSGVSAQQYRAIVTTAGSAVTAGYVMLRAF